MALQEHQVYPVHLRNSMDEKEPVILLQSLEVHQGRRVKQDILDQ